MGIIVIGKISIVIMTCVLSSMLWIAYRREAGGDYWWGMMAGYAAMYLICYYTNPLTLERLPFTVILLLLVLTGYTAYCIRRGTESPAVLAGFFLAALVLGCGQN